MDRLTLPQIPALPTLERSHTDDLKVENDATRVWLLRMTVADGAPYDHEVSSR